MKKSHYFMQSNQLEASEIYRLEYQTDFDGLYEEYIQPHITGRKSFLDIGCGSGGLLEAIARKKDRLKLVGIDQDKQKTQHTRFKLKNRSDTIVKTAMADQLPFESNSFDLVFSRFVLDHITRREQVIKEMFRVCGKGGKVILQSVDGGLLFHYPENEKLQTIKSRLNQVLESYGYDSNTGRKLKTMALNAGFQNIEIRVSPHDIFPTEDLRKRKSFQWKLENAKIIFSEAFSSEKQAEEAKNYILNFIDRPDAFSYSNLITVTAQKVEAAMTKS